MLLWLAACENSLYLHRNMAFGEFRKYFKTSRNTLKRYDKVIVINSEIIQLMNKTKLIHFLDVEFTCDNAPCNHREKPQHDAKPRRL